MAWNTYTRARYGASKSCLQAMARILRDHDQDLVEVPFETDASGNTASGSFVDIDTFAVRVPDEAYGFWTLNIWPYLDGEGEIQIEDDDTTDTGTAVAFNVTTTDAPSAVSIDIDAAWAAVGAFNMRTFNIQMKATAGTVTMDLGDRLCIWWSVT